MLVTFFFICLLALPVELNAAVTSCIEGRISVVKSGDYLPGANVLLQGTNFGAATDRTGYFCIMNIPAGTYTVMVSYVGYDEYSETVTIEDPDERDLLPVLDAITSSRGWIKSTKESLIVRLEPLEVARFKDAQVQLCRKMNNEKIKLPNGKLLQFDVGSDPYSVQK